MWGTPQSVTKVSIVGHRPFGRTRDDQSPNPVLRSAVMTDTYALSLVLIPIAGCRTGNENARKLVGR
jgi:hypothetical protein